MVESIVNLNLFKEVIRIIKDILSMWDTALTAAVIGSILIISNEQIKLFFEQRQQQNKFTIWTVLEQTGNTAPSLTPEQISQKTRIPIKKLKPLLYEMIEKGTIVEAPFSGTFSRYKREVT